MVKNVTVKLFLKSTIFKGFSMINTLIPKNDNIVILYSANKGI